MTDTIDPESLSEGDLVDLDALPDNEMNHSGKLEDVGYGVLAATYGDLAVEFEFANVRVTDVTLLDERYQ